MTPIDLEELKKLYLWQQEKITPGTELKVPTSLPLESLRLAGVGGAETLLLTSKRGVFVRDLTQNAPEENQERIYRSIPPGCAAIRADGKAVALLSPEDRTLGLLEIGGRTREISHPCLGSFGRQGFSFDTKDGLKEKHPRVSLAISPDGRFLALGNIETSTVFVLDWESGLLLSTLSADVRWGCRFSPDSRALLCWGAASTYLYYEDGTSFQLPAIQYQLTPDGQSAVYLTLQGHLQIGRHRKALDSNAKTFQGASELRGYGLLRLSPDGRLVALISSYGLRVFSTGTLESVSAFSLKDLQDKVAEKVTNLGFSSDQKRVYLGLVDLPRVFDADISDAVFSVSLSEKKYTGALVLRQKNNDYQTAIYGAMGLLEREHPEQDEIIRHYFLERQARLTQTDLDRYAELFHRWSFFERHLPSRSEYELGSMLNATAGLSPFLPYLWEEGLSLKSSCPHFGPPQGAPSEALFCHLAARLHSRGAAERLDLFRRFIAQQEKSQREKEGLEAQEAAQRASLQEQEAAEIARLAELEEAAKREQEESEEKRKKREATEAKHKKALALIEEALALEKKEDEKWILKNYEEPLALFQQALDLGMEGVYVDIQRIKKKME